MDLTEDTIQRVAAEASILSSIRNNPNVVNIMGVTVLPPRYCLLLYFETNSIICDYYCYCWVVFVEHCYYTLKLIV